MTLDRTEAAGFGVAVVGHAALAAALWYLIDPTPEPERVPPPPSIEVSFVEDAGLISSGQTSESAAASFAPEAALPEEAAPAEAAPVPEPVQAPIPQPSQPSPSPAERRAAPTPPPAPAQQRAEPRQRQQNRQAGAGRGDANRGSALGPDFLKGLGNDPASASQRAPGAVMSAEAQADIASMIVRQVQPCANRQRKPGPGAEHIVVTIRLRLNRDGSLAAPPAVVGNTANESNRRYLERVTENAIATFTGCSPLRGLPAELYDVARGWRDFRLRYRLPG